MKPLPLANVQPDGLNPHGTGSYLVVYEKKLGDFVLDFEYKLSKGCNSGVFLRVGDLGDPVNTGIEVALDDTTGSTQRDSGAFYGLVAPVKNAQKPAGEWNHMTITAQGPVIAVTLNGEDVSRIDVDEWTVPGKRPDGSDHKFKGAAIARLPRSGYLGFQDLRGDCWFKNIILRTPGGPFDPVRCRCDDGPGRDEPAGPARATGPAAAGSREASASRGTGPPTSPARTLDGNALAEQGRWKEPAAAFERSLAQKPGDWWTARMLMAAYLELGDLDAIRRYCKEHEEALLAGNDIDSFTIYTLVPDALSDYRRVVDRARSLATGKRPYIWSVVYAALLYRAGEYQRAAVNLHAAISTPPGGGAFARAFLAMALYHLKRPNAPGQLNRAQQEAGGPYGHWLYSIETQHLVKQAERELSQTVK